MRSCLPFVVTVSLLSAPFAAAALERFEFSLERFEVTGSITYVDEFEDASRTSAPTRRLVDRGTTFVTESSGRLRLSPDDGATPTRSSTLLGDQVFLDRSIPLPGADASVAGTFPAEIPDVGDQCVGVYVDDFVLFTSGTGTTSTSGAYLKLCSPDTSAPVPASCRAASSPMVVLEPAIPAVAGCVSVDLGEATGSVVLRLDVDGATATATARFSLDGGATYTPVPGSVSLFPATRLSPGALGQGRVSAEFAGLVRAPGPAPETPLVSLTGEAWIFSALTGVPDLRGEPGGSFQLTGAGGDFRLFPGEASFDQPGGLLGASATPASASARRADLETGRLLRPDAPADARCIAGDEPGCLAPGEVSPVNARAFDAICDLSRGFSAIDRSRCALDIFLSTRQPLPAVSAAQLLGLFLSGSPTGIATAANPAFLGPGGGLSRIPFVALSIDPGDGTPLGSFSLQGPNFALPGFASANHNARQTLAQVLSAEQQGLVGCGPLHGSNCDGGVAGMPLTPGPGGMDLRRAEASVLVQSFAPPDEDFRADDAGIAQPGTVGSAGDPVCERETGESLVVLPGCRGPSDEGYDASDGADPALRSIGFPAGQVGLPALPSPATGPIAHTQGHPFTGQTWRSEMAALSWNFQMLLVAFSRQNPTPGLDPVFGFEPQNAYRTDGCSYVKPQLCTGVLSFLASTQRLLDGDPRGHPLRRFDWESGFEYAVTTAVGRFGRFEGGRLHVFPPSQFSTAPYVASVGFLPVAQEFPDGDSDGVIDANDRCPAVLDHQEDADGDDVGDACDVCLFVANTDQRDTNGDGFGNACDTDLDGNGVTNFADLALFKAAFLTSSPDADFDGNGVVNFLDLARMKASFFRPPGPSATAP